MGRAAPAYLCGVHGRVCCAAPCCNVDASPEEVAQALRKAMASSAGAAEQFVQTHAPIESADFFADAFGSQQVAYPPMRAGDTQCYAAARKVELQLAQHARARKIDMG